MPITTAITVSIALAISVAIAVCVNPAGAAAQGQSYEDEVPRGVQKKEEA